MKNLENFRYCVQRVLLLSITVGLIAGCARPATEQEQALDELRVTSNSEVFKAVASDMRELCSNPAEFGRCGCYMDGLETSCSLVGRCLELGFCKAVATAESERKDATSQSDVFTSVATSYQQICNHPAEFGRCGCFLDGLQTSCTIVDACLRNGFCVAVRE